MNRSGSWYSVSNSPQLGRVGDRPILFVGRQQHGMNSFLRDAQMLDDVLPAGLAVGQHQVGAAGGPADQPRVQPLRHPAPVGRQQQGNQIVDGDGGRAGLPAGRSPVGHEGDVAFAGGRPWET